MGSLPAVSNTVMLVGVSAIASSVGGIVCPAARATVPIRIAKASFVFINFYAANLRWPIAPKQWPMSSATPTPIIRKLDDEVSDMDFLEKGNHGWHGFLRREGACASRSDLR